MLHPFAQIRLVFGARWGAGDTRGGHRSQELPVCWYFAALLVPNTGYEKSNFSVQETVSRLARNAVFNANLPCGIGT